ncbi:hypothetical protein TVAG_218780 [Trichomonas vaginalis G3]|uniref:Nucleoplasmin-like domain-containing protein n=1 Tax=Trichomonas vaginalis (strain ATCC PRA-98 / G3) TaxID=412133 RepID=A2G6W1_TRIV3|nr:hypothetical protein TVAG_218780 [Trichomonas vaginalis G3]|eukprot:XP_001300031.1 hypothetical protein [Trichomonas vaginalis G3]
MEGDPIKSFVSFKIPAGKEVKVTIPDGEEFTLTSISLFPDNSTPKSGKILVSAIPVSDDNKKETSIAIAPLIIGKSETASVYLEFNCYQPIIFSTKGAKATVLLSGTTETTTPLQIDVL